MAEWLILAAANLLKAAIVGGLSLLSWGVHHLAPCPDGISPSSERAQAVAAAECSMRVEAAAEARGEVEARLGELRVALIRVGTAVPPIRVETFYAPDVLHPAEATVPPAVAARIQRERPAQAG